MPPAPPCTPHSGLTYSVLSKDGWFTSLWFCPSCLRLEQTFLMVLPAKRGEFLIKTQTQGPSISSNNIPQLKFVQAPAGSCDSSCRFVLSHFSRVWLFVTPRARQALLSMGFCRQEYWRGLPLPSAGDFPDHGIEPVSPAQAEPGKPLRALPPALIFTGLSLPLDSKCLETIDRVLLNFW